MKFMILLDSCFQCSQVLLAKTQINSATNAKTPNTVIFH